MSAKHVFWTTSTGVVILAALAYLAWRVAGKPPYTGWYDLGRTVVVVFAALGAIPAGYIAYRRQKTLETQREDAARTEQRLKTAEETRQLELATADRRADAKDFRTRYTEAAAQLGHDKPAVRLAGVHAMAQLADDWGLVDIAQRQTCVDILCAYICLPPPAKAVPDLAAETDSQLIRDPAETRVPETIVRVISQHLQVAGDGWTGLNFDFTGADFSSGRWDFRRSNFSDGTVRFDRATFSGGTVDFSKTSFSGAVVSFNGAIFSSATISFIGAEFTGAVSFNGATFAGGRVNFGAAMFASRVRFDHEATFSGSIVDFWGRDHQQGGSIRSTTGQSS